MADLSHVAFHLALCRASSVSEGSNVPIHVSARYEIGRPFFDEVVQAVAGPSGDATLELELPRGHEFVTFEQIGTHCGTRDFVTVLPDHDRRIEERLAALNETQPFPAFQMSGTASISFLASTKPTIAAFPAGLACNAPVPAPLPIDVDATYESGAYYLSMLDDQSLATAQPVLALRLKTPSGKPHYIRLPMKPNSFGHGMMSLQMDVTDDMVDAVATEPQDVLLCPKIWETSVL